MKNKTFLNWSGGKDALFALHKTKENKEYAVDKLLTTFNQENKRVNMHGIHIDLMQKQAENIGIPLKPVFLKPHISLNDYNKIMNAHLEELKKENYTHAMFGDLLLEDLKEHREKQLKSVDLKAVFPLWKKDTKVQIHDFLNAGYKAIIVSTNDKFLESSFCGRILDEKLLKDLPENVDPCGENGEFHTFVYDGPLFEKPVNFEIDKIVEKKYYPSTKTDDKDQDCFKKPASGDIKFHFADLVLK